MTKLTTERLEKFVNDIKADGMCDITDHQVESALIQLLAYEQAAKNPVAYRNKFTGQFFTLEQQQDAATDAVVYEPVFLAAPAQPVIPERLIQAINRLLDNDGSRGCFDALEQHRAKTELERLLAAVQQNEPQNIPENIPAQPVGELRARAIALYKPPFKFDFGYIWDADGQIVADQKLNEDGQILRVRGWGRISYLENPEALQDEVGEIIAIALSEYWDRNIAAAPAQESE